jgi:D-tagatose-1,6-bisphosphate aldolase subunit GatZ/KbaZ
MVLDATLRHTSTTGGFAVIEATSNQVNQDGGYTGMRPVAYRDLVLGLASSIGVPRDRVVLGGDHLGPNCWQHMASAAAMRKAGDMVAEYVAAGFRKIHLDCSMSCADDPRALGDALVAERSAALCARAEATWRELGGEPPVYIIGTEVPVPGGAHETLTELTVTTPESARRTIAAHHAAFARDGLDAAWQRVIGLVVQPGVEFAHDRVIDYQPAKASALSQSIVPVPGMVFEAHSTDYQTPTALKQLVRDHFAILKVGPGLTFAMREALWALSDIAQEMGLAPESSIKRAVLGAMRADPSHWKAYYLEADRLQFNLQFSLSDRIRYYWARPEVAQVCARMLGQLARQSIPLTLLSQYLPMQYDAIREGRLENEPHALIHHRIAGVLDHYANACDPGAAPARTAVA